MNLAQLCHEADHLEHTLLMAFCREQYFSDRWKRLGLLVTRAKKRKLRRMMIGSAYSER